MTTTEGLAAFDVRRWRKCELTAINRQLLSEKFRNESFPKNFRSTPLNLITEVVETDVARRKFIAFEATARLRPFSKRKFRDWSKYFDNLTRRDDCLNMGSVMVRPAVMAGAADGISTVVVAEANAAPAAPPRGWLPCPPSLQGQAATSS